MTYSVVDYPLFGTLSGSAPFVTFTPDVDYFGSDSFTFKVNDGEADSNLATVSTTVTAVNDAPIASSGNTFVVKDIPKGSLGHMGFAIDSEDDYEFIRKFGENLGRIVTGVKDKGKETTIIADVHTDTNTNQVLEEGVGYVDLILVAYKVPDGRVIVGAGPVFSYYEFKHPMDDRLTDEQWKTMPQNGGTPPRPDWVSSFVSE